MSIPPPMSCLSTSLVSCPRPGSGPDPVPAPEGPVRLQFPRPYSDGYPLFPVYFGTPWIRGSGRREPVSTRSPSRVSPEDECRKLISVLVPCPWYVLTLLTCVEDSRGSTMKTLKGRQDVTNCYSKDVPSFWVPFV